MATHLVKFSGMILLLALCSYGKTLRAQQSFLRHFTIQDGLPSNVVYDCFQDSKGFIWFATDQGISRFDGHEFKNYSTKDGLPDNEVLHFMEDQLHRCWLISYNMKPCYMRNGRIYNGTNDTLCRIMEQRGIGYRTVYINPDGDVCFAGKQVAVLKKNGELELLQGVTFATPVFYTSQGRDEYMITGDGLFKFENGRTQDLQFGGLSDGFRHGNDLYINQNDINGKLIRCTIDDKGIRVRDIILAPSWIQKVYLQPDGDLLLCTESGVWLYNNKTGKFSVYIDVLQYISVNRMLADPEGNRWFTTVHNGVYLYHKAHPKIYNAASGLDGTNLTTVRTVPDGRLMAGTDMGVLHIIDHEGAENTIAIQGDYRRNKIRSAFALNESEYLIGSDHGLYLGSTHPVKLRVVNSETVKYCILQDGHCLVAGAHIAYRYDIGSGKQTILRYGYATTIAEDLMRNVWIGTFDGLYYGKEKDFTKLAVDTILSHSRIISLAVTPQNRLVIGTGKSGVFIRAEDTVIHLEEKDGLSSNNCKKVIADKDGTVWLCTDNGLDRIRFDAFPSYNIYNYSFSDGLFSAKINDIDINGNYIYAATAEGVILLNKHNPGGLTRPPIVYITSVNDSEYLFANNEVRFEWTYDRNNVEISYTAISFSSGKDIFYKYFLEGGNKDTVTTLLNTINFSSLTPGPYRLYVWARGKKSGWGKYPAIFTFRIQPPFWQTWWFRSLSLTLVVCLAGLAYRMHIRRIQATLIKDANRRRQLADLEMQALRAQINPHFVFNALNSIQHYYSRNDELTANHYMTSFARFMRQTLAHSRSHWLALEEEISRLKTYIDLEQMRFQQTFQYEIRVSQSIAPGQVSVPAMLIQPYVENAISHGVSHLKNQSGQLYISFELGDGVLVCIIDDNGIGIEHSKQHKNSSHQSLGMHINHRRIEAINQLYDTSIHIDVTDKKKKNRTDHGTTVMISIPLKITQEHAERIIS